MTDRRDRARALLASRGMGPALVVLVLLSVACATADPGATAGTTSGVASTRPTPRTTAIETPPPIPSPTPTPTAAPVPDPAATYTDPTALAGMLVQAERTIREDDPDPAMLEGWARVQQALYRQLADRPDWHEPVRDAVPAELADTVERNLRATVELRRLTKPREELPDWRIVKPPPASELLAAYHAAADEFGIDWTLLAAIHLVETRMGRIRGDSTAGARGPMQFLPATWDAYGVGDIEDPHDAIRAAARYLADHGAPADVDAALYAYNHSDRYVRAVKDHAAVMSDDIRAYHAYHAWQVYYRLASGDVVLQVGFDNTR